MSKTNRRPAVTSTAAETHALWDAKYGPLSTALDAVVGPLGPSVDLDSPAVEALSPETLVEALIETAEVSPEREDKLRRAVCELGCIDLKTLLIIREALRCSTEETIVLPAGRYQDLSRGRGWARKGTGSAVQWGERTASGHYRVGAGRWSVGSTDGFKRKSAEDWKVEHILVGTETWTVAS